MSVVDARTTNIIVPALMGIWSSSEIIIGNLIATQYTAKKQMFKTHKNLTI